MHPYIIEMEMKQRQNELDKLPKFFQSQRGAEDEYWNPKFVNFSEAVCKLHCTYEQDFG